MREKRDVQSWAKAGGMLLAGLLLLSTGACGDGAVENGVPVEATSGEGDAETEGYRVYLGNAITDTLHGDATFGRVLDPEVRERRFVIKLVTGFDFGGGFIIARKSSELPSPGTYSLQSESTDIEDLPDDGFMLLYRNGMLRSLRSRNGTLTIDSASDSLITGSFDATLRGLVVERRRRSYDAEVHARGRFRAVRGMTDYIIGL